MKNLIILLLSATTFLSCNMDGNTGIFYGVYNEVNSKTSNLNKNLFAVAMTEDDNFLYIATNTIYSKDKRVESEKIWSNLGEFNFDFLTSKDAKYNCKDIQAVEIDNAQKIFASISIDDNYNKFECNSNPEYNKNFKINQLCYLDTNRKWSKIELTYPNLLQEFVIDNNGDGEDDYSYKQLEIQKIYGYKNSLILVFNERFIRKKYTQIITDSNGNPKEVTNTEKSIKSPIFRLYKLDNPFSSPKLTEITIKYSSSDVKKFLPSAILNAEIFKKDIKENILFATAKNLWTIEDFESATPYAKVFPILLTKDGSSYLLTNKINNISSFYLSNPSPFLADEEKFIIYNGVKYSKNIKPSLYLSLNYSDGSGNKKNRVIRFFNGFDSSNSAIPNITFEWKWVECSYIGQDDNKIIVYNFIDFYHQFYDEKSGKNLKIDKILLSTNKGYLEGSTLNEITNFVNIDYNDENSSSLNNLSTLKLNNATIQNFYKSKYDNKMFAMTANSGLWVNINKVWNRE